MAQLNFDATNVPTDSPFETIDPGEYQAHIIGSEVKETKNGKGHFLQLELEILDGKHAGRKLYDNLNIDNPNQTAVEIATRTLSAVCHATGKLQVVDSIELHEIPMLIKVGIKKDKSSQYEPQNKINSYKPLNPHGKGGIVIPTATTGGTPVGVTAPQIGGKAPWQQ